MPLTAIVIGATGLVGSELVQQLLDDERFSLVKIFVRRSFGKQHPKLEEHIIDFDKIHEWGHLVSGDVLFSALGTTLKQAGGKEAQYRIDYNYQYDVTPNLRRAVSLYNREEIRDKISHGVAFVAKNDPHGPQPPLYMPAWKDKIKGDELEDLISYLFSIKE